MCDRQWLDNFLNELRAYCDNPLWSINYDCDDCEEYLDNNDIYIESGLEKTVFVFHTENFVIKYTRVDGNIDPIKREIDNYRRAVDYGYGKYFAEISDLGFVHETDEDGEEYVWHLAAMEWVCVDEDGIYNTSVKWNSETEEEQDEEEEQDIVEDCFSILYGEKVAEELFHFCYINDINDIHTKNVGWTEDGGLKIIDYSGYGNW